MRVLQEKCLQRLGGKETIAVDVRVIAATHRDLEAAIREKQFREDLYYRLSVVVITLPPLRERREDMPDLVNYFLQKHGPELGNAQPLHPSRGDGPSPGATLARQRARAGKRRAQGPAPGPKLHHQPRPRPHALNKRQRPGLLPGAQPSATWSKNCWPQRGAVRLPDAHARVLEAAEREVFARAIALAQWQPGQSRPLARHLARYDEGQAPPVRPAPGPGTGPGGGVRQCGLRVTICCGNGGPMPARMNCFLASSSRAHLILEASSSLAHHAIKVSTTPAGPALVTGQPQMDLTLWSCPAKAVTMLRALSRSAS